MRLCPCWKEIPSETKCYQESKAIHATWVSWPSQRTQRPILNNPWLCTFIEMELLTKSINMWQSSIHNMFFKGKKLQVYNLLVSYRGILYTRLKAEIIFFYIVPLFTQKYCIKPILVYCLVPDNGMNKCRKRSFEPKHKIFYCKNIRNEKLKLLLFIKFKIKCVFYKARVMPVS